MDIIELYEKLKGSYKSYLESFVAIKDNRIKEKGRRCMESTTWHSSCSVAVRYLVRLCGGIHGKIPLRHIFLFMFYSYMDSSSD